MANVIKITTYVTDMRYRVDLRADSRGVLREKGAGIDAHRDLGACAPGLDDRDRGDRRSIGDRRLLGPALHPIAAELCQPSLIGVHSS